MATPIEEPGWIRDDEEWMRYCSWVMRNLAVGTQRLGKRYTVDAGNVIGVYWTADGKCVSFDDVMAFYAKQTATVDGRK